jgi:hypothetical protein
LSGGFFELNLHKLGGIVGHEREPPRMRRAAPLGQLPRAYAVFARYIRDAGASRRLCRPG